MKEETLKKIVAIVPTIFAIIVLCIIIVGVCFAIYFGQQSQEESNKRQMACFGEIKSDSFARQIINVGEDKYNCCEWQVNLVNNTYVSERKCWALIQ